MLQTKDNEYSIWLTPDSSTGCNTQWFYLRIRGARANTPYRLTVVNLRKAHSLYTSGMQPLVHSAQLAVIKVISCRHLSVTVLILLRHASPCPLTAAGSQPWYRHVAEILPQS